MSPVPCATAVLEKSFASSTDLSDPFPYLRHRSRAAKSCVRKSPYGCTRAFLSPPDGASADRLLLPPAASVKRNPAFQLGWHPLPLVPCQYVAHLQSL